MLATVKDTLRKRLNQTRWGKALWLSAAEAKSHLEMILFDDATYAKRMYLRRTGEILDLENPRSFNEKLWWLTLHNRDPLLTMCADKYRVRDYVVQCGLDHILNKLYGVYDDANEIDFSKLPSPSYLKANHWSGMNILYDRGRPFDVKQFRRTFNAALARNYYTRSREWCYKNIQPKLIVERVLVQNPFLIDWKFLCFDGQVKLVLVDIDVAAQDGTHNPTARRNVYDRDFRLLDVRIGRDHFDPKLVEKPPRYEDMVEYAEILSKPFPHCRVDLYNIEGQIYFGEITFYHGGAGQKITPRPWDEKLGSWIDLGSGKITLKDD